MVHSVSAFQAAGFLVKAVIKAVFAETDQSAAAIDPAFDFFLCGIGGQSHVHIRLDQNLFSLQGTVHDRKIVINFRGI